jgi:hypothetical protein
MITIRATAAIAATFKPAAAVATTATPAAAMEAAEPPAQGACRQYRKTENRGPCEKD